MKKGLNANEVLTNIEAMLKDAEEGKVPKGARIPTWYGYGRRAYKTIYKRWRIRDVYEDLNIFDWWNEYLSVSQLKDMRAFLLAAIKRGYTGYVCFKVGATGCANGMWAHKVESEDGYSPDGAFLYHSFTPAYNSWDAFTDDGVSLGEILNKWQGITLKQVDNFLAATK